MNRVFLIVLDSFGIGEAPDAAKFGDTGANTLKRIASSRAFSIPNLLKLGLSEIDGVDFLPENKEHLAAVARLCEVSLGKDTTIGHWELAGIISENPMPTYPNGFPDEVIDRFVSECGVGILCNKPYSGTDVIRDYGREHKESGKLIVYTSADSVFQIAAHEDVVPVEKLYEYCRIARKILVAKHGVGRVIARPFVDDGDGFKRTANRRDFSLLPPKKTLLDALKEERRDVIAIGKIEDIFAKSGITEAFHTHSNNEGMEITARLADRDFSGLCFVNLVDFDSKYGHREDIDGYAAAISEFDLQLGEFIKKMRDDDALIITADHGCDPGDGSTDHSREFVPLLVYGKGIEPKNLGTATGFLAVAEIVSDMLSSDYKPEGHYSFYEKIRK